MGQPVERTAVEDVIPVERPLRLLGHRRASTFLNFERLVTGHRVGAASTIANGVPSNLGFKIFKKSVVKKLGQSKTVFIFDLNYKYRGNFSVETLGVAVQKVVLLLHALELLVVQRLQLGVDGNAQVFLRVALMALQRL